MHPTEGLIRCPACRAGTLELLVDASVAECPACSGVYPVREGFVDLIEQPRKRSLAQRSMESPTMVRLYESRLWRRSTAIALALGLSFDREHQLVAEALAVRNSEILLDLGCGPGIHTREYARELPSSVVVGLDLSVPMLRYATARARAENFSNIAWIHGDALDVPFADDRLDAVNCCGALHLFPDVRRALSEIARVLKPGGRFATAIFRRRPRGKLALLDDAFDERMLGMASYRSDDMGDLLREAGFAHVECLHDQRIWLIMSART